MRIVTTLKGKTTTLDKSDIAKIDNAQLIMRVLARECPLIESYGRAIVALDEVLGLFGGKKKIIEAFRIREEEDGPEQPASTPYGVTHAVGRDDQQQPELATDDSGADATHPATATG